MGYALLICNCCNCGAKVQCNPLIVPSLMVSGKKEPLCKTCADKWNEIHRTSKGLEPIPIQPGAYDWVNEHELP